MHLEQLIQPAKTIWLTTHRQADGDGLACEVAMQAALRKLGKVGKILNFEPPGNKYRFLFEHATGRSVPVTVFDPDLTPAAPDLIIVFDTNDLRLIEPMAAWASERKVPIGILDHHHGAAPEGTFPVVDNQAASSGEVLCGLLEKLGIEIDSAIATALYASLVFDTQNFRFIRASPRSHVLAAKLLPMVREPERIHEALFASLTPSKLGFIATALSMMKIEADGTLAIVVLKHELFTRFSADPSDSGDVIDMALNVNSVKVAMLLREEPTEREDGAKSWKVSLRSKRGFSVVEAAEALGGGGHRNAAGATVAGEAHTVEAKLKPMLLKEIRKSMGT